MGNYENNKNLVPLYTEGDAKPSYDDDMMARRIHIVGENQAVMDGRYYTGTDISLADLKSVDMIAETLGLYPIESRLEYDSSENRCTCELIFEIDTYPRGLRPALGIYDAYKGFTGNNANWSNSSIISAFDDTPGTGKDGGFITGIKNPCLVRGFVSSVNGQLECDITFKFVNSQPYTVLINLMQSSYFINGGSTEYYLNWLKRSGFDLISASSEFSSLSHTNVEIPNSSLSYLPSDITEISPNGEFDLTIPNCEFSVKNSSMFYYISAYSDDVKIKYVNK